MEDNTIEMESTALTTSESAPPSNIDLPQLENEIKYYLNQISQNVIEIGKRLIQAKSLVKHGEWLNWLEKNFQLSHTSAKRFMQCAERYSNSATSHHLNQSQMIALLSLPEADTEKFIEQKESEGTPVSDMSVKTLRKEIKQWKSETKKIPSAQSSEAKEIDTIDITPVNSQQNQNDTEQITSNESDDTPLDNPVSEEPIYPESQKTTLESQQINNESVYKRNEQEPFVLESPAEIPGTFLIEEIFDASISLSEYENQNEIIQNFAKNNPSKLDIVIQNLSTIISELQALRKNE